MLGWLLLILLALQIAFQPFLYKLYVGPSIDKTGYVVVLECVKFVVCCTALILKGEAAEQIRTFSLKKSLTVAGLPAITYATQNILMGQAYQYTDPITFNLLNQSKILFSSVLLYFFFGKKQTVQQICALVMVVAGGILISYEPVDATSSVSESSFWKGTVPLMLASLLSGLGGAVSQWALQGMRRNSMVFTMELGVYGSLFLAAKLYITGHAITVTQLAEGWEGVTLIPVCLSAFGGILVGLVTKYAGAVAKGISLVCGICLTAVFQSFLEGTQLEVRHMVAVGLVMAGTAIHTLYPHHTSLPPQPAKEKGSDKKKIQ